MLTELPAGPKALDLKPMQSRPSRHRVDVAQCAFGLKDPGSGKPYHKSTSLDVNCAEFAQALERNKKPCRWNREEHEAIQGTGSVNGRSYRRSEAAARWTPAFCRYILKSATEALEARAKDRPVVALRAEVPEED